MSPTVNIIIPTRNRAHYVFSAIKSVLNQTFGDFELIVVDAASIDNTEQVIRKIHDKRVLYIREEKDKGVSFSRNKGISMSRGHFIAFLDDDDIWMSTKLEKQMEILRKEPSIGVVTTGACLFNEQGEIVRLAIPRIDRNIFPEILVRNKVGNCSAVLARRCCLERAGLFDENLHAAEDFDMWIRLAKHCQFACVQEHLLFCRTHIKQISRDYDRVLKATKMLFRKHSVELAALPSHESKRILASWHNELGLLYSQLGAYENARKEFMMAVSNNPFSVLLLARLFKLSLNQRTAELFTSMLDRRFAVSSRWKHMFNSRNRRMRSRSSG